MPNDSIQKLIFALARKMKVDMEKIFAGTGITLFQYAVLKSIQEGSVTQNDIARKLEIKAPSLVPIIDSLVASNYVSRSNDVKDRRKVSLAITKKGNILLKKMPIPSVPAFEKAVATLGRNKKEQLIDLLRQLAESYRS